MDIAALAVELGGPAYAGLLPDSPGIVVERINARTETMLKSRFINARTVLAEVGADGAVALDKLEAFAAMPPSPGVGSLHSSVRWALRFLTSDSGLDIGHPNAQAMLTIIGATGVLTGAEAASLSNLAVLPASRAEVLFGEGVAVTESEVRAASDLLFPTGVIDG